MQSIVAAVQMCSSSSVDENLAVAEQLLAEAAQHGAQLVVLPEMFAIMSDANTSTVQVKEVYGDGKIQSFLSTQAKNNRIWIVGGTIPIACESSNKIKAASLVFDDTGACVARYDKVHLFDALFSNQEAYCESKTTESGDYVTVIDTPFGKIGLAVCYDLRFPELFRCLLNKGAEIIVLPAAFTVQTGQAHWEILARSRAIENFCYFIGSCQGGVHSNGRKTFGNSMIIEPWGTILARKESIEPGIISANLDLQLLKAARLSIPIENHQRIYCAELRNTRFSVHS